MKKFLTILLSVVLIATLCCAVACKGHTWDKEWTQGTDTHWHACLDEGCDEKSDEAPHEDVDNNGICDVCKKKLSTTPVDPCANGHTVTTWTDNEDGRTHSGECSVCHERQTENHVGTDTCTKCGATLGGTVNPPVGTTYTIYYYAPEWPNGEVVYVYTYANEDDDYPLGKIGEYNDNPLTAVTGKAGWYSVDFTTEVEFGTLHIIFHTEEDDKEKNENAVKHEFYVEGITGTSLYFIDNADNIYASEADAEAAYDEIANGTVNPPVGTTYTIYYYAPEWPEGEDVYVYTYGDKEGELGEIGQYNDNPLTAVTGKSGWYSVEFTTAVDFVKAGIIFHTEVDDKALNENAVKHEFYIKDLTGTAFYFIDNGDNVYASEADAEAAYDEIANGTVNPPVGTTYTIYYYAPAWPDGEAVYIYNWGTDLTEWVDNYNGYTMKAVDGKNGWYYFSINSEAGFTRGNLIIHTLDEVVKHEIAVSGLTGTEIYLIDNGEDVYENEADAEAAYKTLAEAPKKELTIHIHVDTDKLQGDKATLDRVTIYAWGTGTLFGAFDSTEMEAEGNGWYVVTIEIPETLTGGEYNLIVSDGVNDKDIHKEYPVVNGVSIEDINEKYINIYGNIFDSLTEATAAENNTTNHDYTIYVYSATAENIYIHCYYGNGTGVGTDYWTTTMNKATELGAGWFKITVTAQDELFDTNPGLNCMIAKDDPNATRWEPIITNSANIYLNLDTKTMAASAEAAVA